MSARTATAARLVPTLAVLEHVQPEPDDAEIDDARAELLELLRVRAVALELAELEVARTPHPSKPASSKAPRRDDWISAVVGVQVDPDAPVPAPRRFALTDLGNAERLKHHDGVDLRYVYEWDAWVHWDGRRWAKDPAAVHVCAARIVRAIPAELTATTDDPGEGASKRFLKHCESSESSRGIRSMVELARPMLRARPEDFDRDPNALNVANGTLDLRTGMLYPHRRADLHTKVSPISYDPSARCPRWDAFVRWAACEDEELIVYLQKYAGYVLSGDVSEQVFQVWHGGGANGKGTFVRVLFALLGDYAMNGAPGLLLSRYGETHPTELAAIQGARLVVCQETEEGKRLDESRVKQLTGEDLITARFMHRDFFQFPPTAKFLLVSNSRPVITGTDHGIWRRLHLVPWDATIADEQIDPYLTDRLLEELPGILAWAVRGAVAWRAARLGRPARLTAATAAYRKEQDQIGQFLDDACDTGAAHLAESSGDLYRTYAAWSKERGEHSVSQKRFGMELEKRKFVPFRDSQGGRWWRGLALRRSLGG